MTLSIVGLGESLSGGVSLPIDDMEGVSQTAEIGQLLSDVIAQTFVGDLTLLLDATLTLGGAAAAAQVSDL